MHQRLLAVLPAAAAAFAVAAAPASALSHHRNGSDEQWLQAAIQGDRFEVAGGAAAQTRGSAQAAKDLGARLESDHSAALRKAVKLARRLGIHPPAEPTESQKWELSTTAGFTGTAFDQHYTSLEVADHKDDISEVKDEIADGVNPAVLRLARADLKMYRKHLKLSEAAAKAVGL